MEPICLHLSPRCGPLTLWSLFSKSASYCTFLLKGALSTSLLGMCTLLLSHSGEVIFFFEHIYLSTFILPSLYFSNKFLLFNYPAPSKTIFCEESHELESLGKNWNWLPFSAKSNLSLQLDLYNPLGNWVAWITSYLWEKGEHKCI